MSKREAGAVEVFVFKGSRFLGSRCFTQRTIVIGRGSGATLKLSDPGISEKHAIVRVEGGTVVLADNKSKTGVYVNGERIDVRKINSFDEITIGSFRIKLALMGSEEEDHGFGHERSATDTQGGLHPDLQEAGDDEGRTRVRAAPEPEEARTGATVPRITPAARRKSPSAVVGESDAPARGRPAEPKGRTRAARGDQGAEEEFAADPRTRREGPGKKARPAARPPADETDEPAAKRKKGLFGRARPEEDEEELASDHGQDTMAELDLGPAPADVAPPGGALGDDEDEDEAWVPPFSLLENVVRERFKTQLSAAGEEIVEVIRYRDGDILDLMRAEAGKGVSVGHDDFTLVVMEPDGRAQLYFQKGFSGTVVSGGKARPIKKLCVDKYLVSEKDELYAVELQDKDYAQVIRDEAGYLVRFVRPPLVPQAPFKPHFSLQGVQAFVGSLAFHFLVFVLLGFTSSSSEELKVADDAERFAQVDMKDLKMEKPPEEEKKPDPEPEPEPEQPPETVPEKPKKIEQPKHTPKKPVKVVRQPEPREPSPPRPSKEERARAAAQQKQVGNVLSALQNIKPAGGPGRADLKSLASNISAVRAPSGTASDFKVSGVIGKLPGNAVRLSGGFGGSGGRDTKVGTQLLRGSNVGSIKAIAGTGTRVRGRVGKAPTRAISATGGVLSREAIQKVVAEHMAAIQACYERQLIHNPGLAGKVVFDWVISTSGSVSSARMVSSSVANPAVASCILGEIRTWHFPQPQGGSVQVRYPFVFRIQGF
ncbi:MAG: AgmX/PglI C-terminal domain-containing protein [Deltaproteobacteria bacterium]|nr:AgmX/PglI C-terminal domain-containing protein [Deltaproteobacteria bacterium]